MLILSLPEVWAVPMLLQFLVIFVCTPCHRHTSFTLFFFLENLNAEVLHLIGLVLVVPIQGFFVIPYYYLRTCRLDKSWFTSYNNLWVVVYIFFCFLFRWTLYKLLVIRIVHDCFIIVCYIVHTFSPPFCWKWKIIRAYFFLVPPHCTI